MTEKTGKPARHDHHLIDPVMFFAALISAPLLVTLASFWLLLIPVAALVMGGPIYLVIATPLLMWWLGRHPPHAGEIALLGFMANLIAAGGIYAFAALEGARDASGVALFYLGFGSIFAPIWALVFAWMYRSWRRPFFEQTV